MKVQSKTKHMKSAYKNKKERKSYNRRNYLFFYLGNMGEPGLTGPRGFNGRPGARGKKGEEGRPINIIP